MSTPLLETLAWDSQFLGFGVARAVVAPVNVDGLNELLAEARAQQLRLVYLLLDPADSVSAAAVQRVGGQLVDRKVLLQRPLAGPLPSSPSNAQLVRAWSPALEELAWQSGTYSRFRLDPKFAPGVFERLYSQWLRDSLAGELARAVWACFDPDGTPTGLLTMQADGEVATIGLLAVRAGRRGQGLGQYLLQAALPAAREWQCAQVRVTTQLDNARACRFYAYCGFTPAHIEHVYHLWL
ncbi:GNAT family N-acetyltransferase [Hymenobacter sp. DH14]|uniref:GNAT family N-acetyltransferase n=1 Tax=Hymenobacter cyanobacteriorum TaxID=2926463 RepID=A0A9X1VGS8_9BACT|nr:GNAT family N-acetyltransferase [Hymenobacter cyanobacteriorum]MCI1188914.1 GNAT family N-acetyltransferase [Hymenobacter cyanobacteriorum]